MVLYVLNVFNGVKWKKEKLKRGNAKRKKKFIKSK